MLRFRIFGIPIVITGYFWIGAVLLGGIGQSLEGRAVLRLAIWVGCVLVSIIVHELGHAAAGRGFGAAPSIVLHGIGGMTYLPGVRLTRPRSILVSLAGPLAGFALGGAVILIRSRLGYVADDADPVIFSVKMASSYLVFINLIWTLFNLLPILPLDGGQVLRDTLGPRWIGLTRAIGGLVAAVVAGFALWFGQIYLGFFLGYLAYINYRGNPRELPGGVSR